VLLTGESGTGKELAAQTIHDMSRRGRACYLAVNCGAISPQLIESEMFGHEKGSFTGADRLHRGYFERADGGTLFLDEITEMPVELQVKLLRVLETSRFMRIGTDREIETDVRIIAATNRSPEAAIVAGKLRADLYHRLNVFPLQLPSLRDRSGDVPLLAEFFLKQFNGEARTAKKFNEDTLGRLEHYSWPGNVRELRNFVQRAWILANDRLDFAALSLSVAPTPPETSRLIEIPVGMTLEEADKRLILATLEQNGGVKKRTAELLGISLKTLYNRLEEYGLQQKSRNEVVVEDADE
jgi:DNA-binding NtrC family response regulator